MSKKVLFIINPVSGTQDKEELDQIIENFCESNGIRHAIFKTTGENDAEKIIQEISEYQPEVVFAGGGDGTVKLVAEQLLGSEISLGILPLGSANGFATDLGLPAEIDENLKLIEHGKRQKTDAIKVNGELCLHLSDIGFNAELIKEFEREGQRGMIGYAKSFFKKIGKISAAKFDISTDSGHFQHKAEMLVIANASKYGTGAVVNPRSNMQDGLFELCVFKPIPWYRFFSLTWHSFVGRLEEFRYFSIHQTQRATIQLKKPRTLQVDGEIIGNVKKVEVEMLKGALNILITR